jgi:hypothetical protein
MANPIFDLDSQIGKRDKWLMLLPANVNRLRVFNDSTPQHQ